MAPFDLTVPIIACNAQRTLARTIESVRPIAQHVIVIDSGSGDATRRIAENEGAEVIERAWEGYVKQKQFALEQCSTRWALSLDSDEAVDQRLAEAIGTALESSDDRIDGYQINRRVVYRGRELRHTWQPEWRTRLVRVKSARWAGYDPHSRLEVDGRVERLPGTILHDAFDTISEFVKRQVTHGLLTAESYYDLGKRGSAAGLLISPTSAVFKQLVLRMAWLDGWIGWVAAFGTGVHAAAKQMRLLELTHEKGQSGS